MRALIVGAGIGGLTAAVALRRAGHDVLVLERAPELEEVGAGISLWPNAIKALRRLGLGAEVEAAGEAVLEGSLRTWRGRRLPALDPAQLEARFGAPLMMFHRAELHRVLHRAAGEEVVRLGAECVGVEQDAQRATVRLSDGSWERGDLVVGADGIRSTVRAAVAGESSPLYSGLTSWRAVVELDGPLAERVGSGESWGRGSLFGFARLPGGRVYWYAAARARKGGGGEPGEKERLRRFFGKWHEPTPEVIGATPASAIIRTDLYDRPPLVSWSSGRLTLLGDAAHPMLPNLGQGGCQAIEDALALADALGREGDVVAALAAYSARRARRAARVVRQSRQMARVAHLVGPAALGRNMALRLAPASFALRRLAPIVGGEESSA
jgi:2-polyprenyl-6-methoxyphenol hydroxylase-like FAD-dependent oxidoreductase